MRSFWKRPGPESVLLSRLLLGCFVVYLGIRLLACGQTALLEDHDSLGYLRDAAAWQALQPEELSPDSTPFYPVTTALVGLSGVSLETAGRMVSLAFSVLLFVSLLQIGRRISEPSTVLLALAALTCSPLLIGLSFSVLSEPSYIATVYFGIWIFCWGSEQPRAAVAALLGLVFGCAFLNRTEGLLYIGLIPVLQAAHWMFRRPRRYSAVQLLLWCLVYVAVFGALSAPQVVSVSRKLGTPAINGRQVWMAIMNNPDGKSTDEKIYGLDYSPRTINLDYLQAHPDVVASFRSDARYLDTARVAAANFRELVQRQLRILLGVPGLVFFAAGLVAMLRGRHWWRMFLVSAIVGSGLFGPLLYNVASRHIAIVAPVMLLVAGAGIAELARWLPGIRPGRQRLAQAGLLAVWLLAWAPELGQAVLNPPTSNREYSPASLAQPAQLVRSLAGADRAAKICSRKGYLAHLSRGVRQPLPYTDHDGLIRYMQINRSDFLFLNYGILRRFPFLERFESGVPGPEFQLLYRGPGSQGKRLELYRFRPEPSGPS